ncbi:helix-turn-helix domain-containing protein [Pedobacter cryoconitis]|uniref:helix-turn-helix domain-containing protein n=1 Tax=Pedobacter cryoconitis TaxID=188932 RepID=UPI0016200938
MNDEDGIILIVWKNIAKFRDLKGLSQRQLAILCNIENSSVSKYENGKVWPNLKTLSNIARALEIHIGRLFE